MGLLHHVGDVVYTSSSSSSSYIGYERINNGMIRTLII